MIPSWNAAQAIAERLDGAGLGEDWKAVHDGLGEITFTDENGVKFRITVDEIEDEDGD